MTVERPRFRRDLAAKPFEAEGIQYVEAVDPRTGDSFGFYDFEHAVAQALDGRPLPEVIPQARERTGLDLSVEQLGTFAERLAEMGFLEPDATLPAPAPAEEAAPPAPAEPVPPPPEAPAATAVEEARSVASVTVQEVPAEAVEEVPAEAVEEVPVEAVEEQPPPPDEVVAPVEAEALAPPSAPKVDAPAVAPEALPPVLPAEAPRLPDLPAEPLVEAGSPPPTASEPAAPNALASPPSEAPSVAPEASPPEVAVVAKASPPEVPTEDVRPPPEAPDAPAAPEPAPDTQPGFATTAPMSTTPPPPARRRRVAPLVYAFLGTFFAGAVGFVAFRMTFPSEPPPIPVRTLVPSVGTVYRWLDATGSIEPSSGRTLVFPAAGKVASVLDAGAGFQPGDIVAEIDGARRIKNDLAHNRERLAYYEQMRDTMRSAGNRPEERQAELKIAEKKRLVADAQEALAKIAVVATLAGEVDVAMAAVGATVAAGAPAVRLKGGEQRARIELSREDAERVRQLGFCRAEIEGKPLDCVLAPDGGDETHVLVDLPLDPVVAPGKRVRLARARYDGVFVLPASALAPAKGGDRRVYVVRDGKAEPYAVVLADQSSQEIVVSQGLETGSAVIVEAPPDLRPGARVSATETKQQP